MDTRNLVVTIPSEVRSQHAKTPRSVMRPRKKHPVETARPYSTPEVERHYHRSNNKRVVISPQFDLPAKESVPGTSPTSQLTTSTQDTTYTITKTTQVSRSGNSVATHRSSQSTKTTATYNRKSRLPSLLKFRKKRKSKKPAQDALDNSSHTSDITQKSKSALLTEFGTLMNEFPTDDTLNTTLHVACAKHYSDSLIVDQLIAKGPSAVSMRNQQRDLPLHSAMKCVIGAGVDDRVFDELVKRHPVGVEAVNRDNCLPIHLACKSGGRNVYVTKRLLELYPMSAIMKCDLKLPFDDKALQYIQNEPSNRPQTPKYANADSLDKIEEDTIEETESCVASFWSGLLMLSPRPSFEAETKTTSADPGSESDFSPLHLAVMFGAPPDVIETIITTNPTCLDLRTDQGRKAIDCGQFIVKGKRNRRPKNLSLLRMPSHDDDEDEVRINTYIKNIDADPDQNIFAAIEILKTFEGNQRKRLQLASATTMTAKSLKDLTTVEEFDPKKEWRKLGNLIRITRAFKLEGNKLGSVVPSDEKKAFRPRGYEIPDHYKHVCLDLKIPVGFRRLRWALLSSESSFENVEVFENKLKYTKVNMGQWDKHNEEIGSTDFISSASETSFIGAERKCEYLMPKSAMVGANMGYETSTIIDYNDYAFVVRKVTTNPDVPFGKSFECHVQTVIINLGNNSCRMLASVEARFIGRPPMIAWKIKNAMYNGVTDFFVARGEIICEHAIQDSPNADQGGEGD